MARGELKFAALLALALGLLAVAIFENIIIASATDAPAAESSSDAAPASDEPWIPTRLHLSLASLGTPPVALKAALRPPMPPSLFISSRNHSARLARFRCDLPINTVLKDPQDLPPWLTDLTFTYRAEGPSKRSLVGRSSEAEAGINVLYSVSDGVSPPTTRREVCEVLNTAAHTPGLFCCTCPCPDETINLAQPLSVTPALRLHHLTPPELPPSDLLQKTLRNSFPRCNHHAQTMQHSKPGTLSTIHVSLSQTHFNISLTYALPKARESKLRTYGVSSAWQSIEMSIFNPANGTDEAVEETRSDLRYFGFSSGDITVEPELPQPVSVKAVLDPVVGYHPVVHATVDKRNQTRATPGHLVLLLPIPPHAFADQYQIAGLNNLQPGVSYWAFGRPDLEAAALEGDAARCPSERVRFNGVVVVVRNVTERKTPFTLEIPIHLRYRMPSWESSHTTSALEGLRAFFLNSSTYEHIPEHSVLLQQLFSLENFYEVESAGLTRLPVAYTPSLENWAIAVPNGYLQDGPVVAQTTALVAGGISAWVAWTFWRLSSKWQPERQAE
ncbi:hypothetical protein DFJ73DRAFT_815242 [Zopfochytrium polystomum]|nr:hypothetical protein DFJ73DRAFT_815242 [Zopfochytrium polystomum]